ncbi:hypothetical protein MZM54_02940 [[Brevibacterium] frigoritolerans]|nr:hypothetical protein [Peribacillus frigoritolerans]
MNLGQLIVLETIWSSDTKKEYGMKPEEVKRYLQEEKQLDDYIDTGYTQYEFAKNTFTKQEWNRMEELLEKNFANRSRIPIEDDWMSVLGEVLWELGELFGTNNSIPPNQLQ